MCISTHGMSGRIGPSVSSNIMTIYHNILGSKKITVVSEPKNVKASFPQYCLGVMEFFPRIDESLSINQNTGETFVVMDNEVVFMNGNREFVIENKCETVPYHINMSWPLFPQNIFDDDTLATRIMRHLRFTTVTCDSQRESRDNSPIPFLRMALMRLLMMGNTQSFFNAMLFPYYVLAKELWEYHDISKKKNICIKVSDECMNFDSCMSCSICGMDLFHSYFTLRNIVDHFEKLCSRCTRRIIEDNEYFAQCSDMFKPSSNLPSNLCLLTSCVMDIKTFMEEVGIHVRNNDRTTAFSSSDPLHEEYSNRFKAVSYFPTLQMSKQFCTVTTKNVTVGKGLVAILDIPPNCYIAEYQGALIPKLDPSDVQVQNIDDGDSKYSLRITESLTLCGDACESLPKYCNHSCKPNAKLVECYLLTDVKHVFLVSLDETIPNGSEITLDYGLSKSNLVKNCLCQVCRNHLSNKFPPYSALTKEYKQQVHDSCRLNEESLTKLTFECLWGEKSYDEQCQMVKVGKFILSQHEYYLLRPNEWLNDNIINAFCSLLNECEDSSYFFTPCGDISMDFDNDVNNLRSRHNNLRNRRTDLERRPQKKHIVFPTTNVVANHWILIVVKRISKGLHVKVYDSYSDDKHDQLVHKAIHRAKLFFNDDSLNIVRKKNISYAIEGKLQENGDDCGVFICMWASHLAGKLDGDIEEIDQHFITTSNCRASICASILTSKIQTPLKLDNDKSR